MHKCAIAQTWSRYDAEWDYTVVVVPPNYLSIEREHFIARQYIWAADKVTSKITARNNILCILNTLIYSAFW
jgi:hypothetical protein